VTAASELWSPLAQHGTSEYYPDRSQTGAFSYTPVAEIHTATALHGSQALLGATSLKSADKSRCDFSSPKVQGLSRMCER